MISLEEKFKRHLQRRRFFSKNDTVIVAVSTGVDSMVLLNLLQKLPVTLRPHLVVAHVNHELRNQSTVEEEFIKDYCDRHHLALAVTHWSRSVHPARGVEAAGRAYRYHFFADLMKRQGARVLVTAHHQNDLAETMLMKLVRGGQLDQLVGIADQRPFASGQLVRPLLPFAKQALVNYARAKGIKWFEDVTNQDLTITRNRYRHEIIPALQRENPRLLDHLTSYHDQLQRLLDWRERWLVERLKTISVGDELDLAALHCHDRADQRALLLEWLRQRGVLNVKQALLTAIEKLLAVQAAPQGQLTLPGAVMLQRRYDKCFLLSQEKIVAQRQNVPASVVKLGQQYFINAKQYLMVVAGPEKGPGQVMWLAPDQFPLTLRHWQTGDFIILKNGGHQKVRRVLIDQKVPQQVRDRQLVLVDAQGRVVWVIGRKWSWFPRPANYQQKWRQVVVSIEDK
ncbi:tRNA lysidine(34) synthetase TilS [Limosilactobacillus panis]|uniref:tRNA lysidine(34) synthetase TilS n=1 Tax=Limosilactobacillus panis TaxID=47493 RepID=UPI001C985AEE|nr:tRNA lysidine(34) synthetase TilS [Limosilactobacillus panis]QZN93384.1 tRNA lysidine(34) synthetase TilS [Limosilactobacillus panis]